MTTNEESEKELRCTTTSKFENWRKFTPILMEYLPFRLVVQLFEFVEIVVQKESKMTDFYGRFKMDKSKKVFCLFKYFTNCEVSRRSPRRSSNLTWIEMYKKIPTSKMILLEITTCDIDFHFSPVMDFNRWEFKKLTGVDFGKVKINLQEGYSSLVLDNCLQEAIPCVRSLTHDYGAVSYSRIIHGHPCIMESYFRNVNKLKELRKLTMCLRGNDMGLETELELPKLVSLELNGVNQKGNVSKIIRKCGALMDLFLDECAFSEPDYVTINGLPHLKKLKVTECVITNEIFMLTNIQSLDLWINKCGDGSRNMVPQETQIKTLILGFFYTSFDFPFFAQIMRLRLINELSLGFEIQGKLLKIALSGDERCEKLRKLSVTVVQFEEASMQCLNKCGNLEELDLTIHSAKELKTSLQLYDLKKLSVKLTQRVPELLKEGSMIRMKHLENLKIEGMFTNKQIEEISSQRTVREIHVSSVPLSKNSFKLFQMKSLESLRFYQNFRNKEFPFRSVTIPKESCLKDISVSCVKNIPNEFFKELCNCQNLQRIKFTRCEVKECDVSSFGENAKWEKDHYVEFKLIGNVGDVETPNREQLMRENPKQVFHLQTHYMMALIQWKIARKIIRQNFDSKIVKRMKEISEKKPNLLFSYYYINRNG